MTINPYGSPPCTAILYKFDHALNLLNYQEIKYRSISLDGSESSNIHYIIEIPDTYGDHIITQYSSFNIDIIRIYRPTDNIDFYYKVNTYTKLPFRKDDPILAYCVEVHYNDPILKVIPDVIDTSFKGVVFNHRKIYSYDDFSIDEYETVDIITIEFNSIIATIKTAPTSMHNIITSDLDRYDIYLYTKIGEKRILLRMDDIKEPKDSPLLTFISMLKIPIRQSIVDAIENRIKDSAKIMKVFGGN